MVPSPMAMRSMFATAMGLLSLSLLTLTYLVGIVLAIVRMQRSPRAATLTIVALVLQLLALGTTYATPFLLMPYMRTAGWSVERYSEVQTSVTLLVSLVH